MTDHLDAVGVALIAAALLVICVIALDRAYTRTAAAQRASHRALRSRDRAAYWRLHHRYALLCSAGITVEQAAAEAEQITAPDLPIPYEVVDAAMYRPVFDGDNTHVAEYAELARAARHIRQGGR